MLRRVAYAGRDAEINPIKTLPSHAITKGVSRDGHVLKPPMAFAWYASMRDEDLDAIVAGSLIFATSDHDPALIAIIRGVAVTAAKAGSAGPASARGAARIGSVHKRHEARSALACRPYQRGAVGCNLPCGVGS